MKRTWSLRRSSQTSAELEAAAEEVSNSTRGKASERGNIPNKVFSQLMDLPPDFDYETQYDTWQRSQNASKWQVPKDIIEVKKNPKSSRFAKSAIPPELVGKHSKGAKTYISECIEYFQAEYTHTNRVHSGEITVQNENQQSGMEEKLRSQKFCDITSKSTVVSSEMFQDPEKVPAAEGVDMKLINNQTTNRSPRDEARINLFSTFGGAQKYLPESPLDGIHPPFEEEPAREFIVEPAEISFDNGNLEPYIGSLSLYNFAKKKKLSETFYFHCNDANQISMLSHPEDLPDAHSAIFRLSATNTDLANIFFILRIEKILQGDVDSVVEPYVKNEAVKAKEKHSQAVTAGAARHGCWQPFGWSTAPITLEDNSFPNSITFKPIYRTREQDIPGGSICSSFDGKGSSRKMKSIPGRCVIRIKVIPPEDMVPGRISPSLIPIVPQADKVIFNEITEFPVSPILCPYTEYMNDLFLYIESVNLSGRTGTPSAKDIAIEVQFLDHDDSGASPLGSSPLPVFYAKGKNEMREKAMTSVTYHNKNPSFYSEMKVKMPALLHPKHHFIFIIKQISVQASKSSKNTSVAIPVAYAFWPIYQSDRVVSKEVLPLYTELHPGYLDDDSSMKAIDSKKPLLTLRIKLNSTIYTQDLHMNSFLKKMKAISISKIQFALKPLSLLEKVHPFRIIKYFPVIMNYVFRLFCTHDSSSPSIFAIFPSLFGSIDDAVPSTFHLLRSYSDNDFNMFGPNDKGLYVHDVLMREWMFFTRDGSPSMSVLLKHASFFFKIIFKSMCLKIHSSGELADPSTRKTRFSKPFYCFLNGLFAVLTWELRKRAKLALTLCKSLCRNMASFVNDLLAIANRSHILKMIDIFLTEMGKEEKMEEFRFEFLSVLIQYEYFVVTSLPVSVVEDFPVDMVPFFKEQHYLASLVRMEVTTLLLHSNDKSIHIKAMDIIRTLFISHEYDRKLESSPTLIHDSAALYLPLLPQIMDHSIITEGVFEEQRDFLICFVFLLKYTEKSLFQQWLKKESVVQVKKFFDFIYRLVSTFQYVGKEEWTARMNENSEVKASAMTKASIESFYSSGGMPKRTSYRQKRADSVSGADSLHFSGEKKGTGERAFKKRTLNRQSITQTENTLAKVRVPYHEVLESNLSNEVMFVILDTVFDYIESVSIQECNPQVFDKICLYILTILQGKQTFKFLDAFFTFLRFLVSKFGKLLFRSSFLDSFCFAVLNYSNCRFDPVRFHASALLYLLMREHYKHDATQFDRITVHITVALSKLIGRGLQTDYYLKMCLANVNEYARLDQQETSKEFEEKIAELSARLSMVLRDNMQIASHSSDPEMMVDLYSRLANGYMNAPSLRVTWLENMGNFHSQQKRYVESAMCNVHIAAMISEYLHATDPNPSHPKGCESFASISPNIIQEIVIRTTDALTQQEEHGQFTEEKMLGYLSHSISELKAADCYELANEVYKLIIPIYEAKHQYALLQTAHAELNELFGDIIECVSSERRMLGSYYRVAFFGEQFQEINNKEFIYKEPKITKLMEIKERLLKIFSEKFGTTISIIVHSNTVCVGDLDPKQCFIQLTSVIPYFEPHELKDRPTSFYQKMNINRFIFVTPFTKTGKARTESVADQFIRKTILTTEAYFPCVRLRLAVSDKTEIELDPLTHTIEEVKKQTARINQEAKSQNSSLKTLQPILSGSVCLQVQAGPLEYARVFFEARSAEWKAEQLKELHEALSLFMVACRSGIEKHKSICQTEADFAFQESLENGLLNTQTKMDSHWDSFCNK